MIEHIDDISQGSYRPWEIWKVMEFYNFIFQAWKVMELRMGHGKSWNFIRSKEYEPSIKLNLTDIQILIIYCFVTVINVF